MKETLMRIKDKIMGSSSYDIPDEFGEDYLEVDLENQPKFKQKVVVRYLCYQGIQGHAIAFE